MALLESRGYEVPREYRFREQWTGMESIYDRPVLNRARKLIESGEVKAWGSYDTDRVARDPRDLITIIGAIHKAGAEPVFVRFDHDTKDRIGEAMVYMKGLASALQWDAIRDATMRGRMKVYESGRWMGYGRVRYGYRWDKESRTRTAHPVHAAIVRRVFEEVASGMLPSLVAQRLNDEGVASPFRKRWVGPTIRVMIREKTYKGVCVGRQTMPTGKRRANGTSIVTVRPEDQQVVLDDARTEPLVSDELWAAANAALLSRLTYVRKPGRSHNAEFLLAGMVWCGREGCGCRMSPVREKRRGGVNRAYRCSGNRPSRKVMTGCARNLGANRLEVDAWNKFERLVSDAEFLKQCLANVRKSDMADTIKADLKLAEDKRKKIDRQVKAMLDAQAETDSKLLLAALKDKLSAMDREAEVLDSQIVRLRESLACHQESDKAFDNFEKMIKSAKKIIDRGGLTLEDKRQLLDTFGVRVTAWPGGCEVEVEVPGWYKAKNTMSITAGVVPPVGVIVISDGDRG